MAHSLRYVVDERGQRKSVVLSMCEYRELMDDLADLALIAERNDEPAEPLEAVKKRLDEKWPNSGSR